MAPLLSLLAFAAFALFSTAAASPHIARHVLDHRHNPVVPRLDIDHPVRRRSLNRRCAPSNATTSPIPFATSSIPSATSAIPSATSSIPSASSSPPPATSSTPSSTQPPPTTSPAPEYTSAAATTTSSPATTPPPATTPSPSPTTTSTPPPAQTSSSSSNSGQPSYLTSTNSGQGTWFDVGLGACGYTNNNNQNIVAVSHLIFDSFPGYNGVNPNSNPICGMTVTIYYSGQEVEATIVDRCVGCAELDLDMAPNAFTVLAALGVGRIDMTWKFT